MRRVSGLTIPTLCLSPVDDAVPKFMKVVMDKEIPGSYGVSPANREQALQNGIFTIDANVLCDLWRYSPETHDAILDTMELLGAQRRLCWRRRFHCHSELLQRRLRA